MQTFTLPTSTDGLTVDDLRGLTNEMIDTMLDIIKDCTDKDVTFEPSDPDAYDEAASSDDELKISWTLGHVIVHATASSEEAASIAAELARGVEWHGRSRSEVPWRTVTTIEQCRHRLEESRHMRLASLEMWPDEPHFHNTYTAREGAPPTNCVRRFLNGLRHDESHLEQLERIVRECRGA
ncbi:MAG: DinB family protein [Chloroflexota bacterium]